MLIVIIFFSLVNVQKRIQGGLKVLQYYTTKEWVFRNDNLKLLANEMSDRDKQIFYMDTKQINWDDYFRNYILGTRQFCLKEDPATIPQARKLLKRLVIDNQTIV